MKKHPCNFFKGKQMGYCDGVKYDTPTALSNLAVKDQKFDDEIKIEASIAQAFKLFENSRTTATHSEELCFKAAARFLITKLKS